MNEAIGLAAELLFACNHSDKWNPCDRQCGGEVRKDPVRTAGHLARPSKSYVQTTDRRAHLFLVNRDVLTAGPL